MKKRPHLLHGVVFAGVFSLVVGAVLWGLYGQKMLLSIYEGRFHPAVDDLVIQHRQIDPLNRTLAYYHSLALAFLARIALLLGGSLSVLWLAWPHFNSRIAAFRAEPVTPEQLAIFRLLVFGVLLYYPKYTAIFRMSTLPHALLVPPPGWEFILPWMPPSPLLAKMSGSLYILGSLGAFLATAPA